MSKISTFSMLLGMGVTVILTILIGGLGEEAVFDTVEPVACVDGEAAPGAGGEQVVNINREEEAHAVEAAGHMENTVGVEPHT